MGKRENNWIRNYNKLKHFVQNNKQLPSKNAIKNRGLLNWWKYNNKLIRTDKLCKEKIAMLAEIKRLKDE